MVGLKVKCRNSSQKMVPEFLMCKILLINVNGIGKGVKRKWVQELRWPNKVNFVFIQESRCQLLEDWNVREIWGMKNFDHCTVGLNGSLCGLLMVWDPKVFEVKMVIKDQNLETKRQRDRAY